MDGFDPARLNRLHDTMAGHVADDAVAGIAWLAARDGDVEFTDQITVEGSASGPSPDGSMGWGFGVGVQLRRTGPARSVGTYGWDGGLGTSWANDPTERLVGVVMTTDMFTSAYPPPRPIQDFWTCAYGALR